MTREEIVEAIAALAGRIGAGHAPPSSAAASMLYNIASVLCFNEEARLVELINDYRKEVVAA